MAAGCCRKQAIGRVAADLTDAGTAIILVNEVTKIGPQHPVADRLLVQQIEIALLVDIFQLRMPQPHLGALLIETVLGTRVIEAVGGYPRRSPGRKILHIRRVAQADRSVLTRLQPQPFDLFGDQHGTAESLRQQAAIVVAQQRNIRQQLTELQLRSGKARFRRNPGTAEIVSGATVIVYRQQFRTAGQPAAVQLDPEHGYPLQTKAHRPRGVARVELENKTLRPLIHLAFSGARITEVTVEIVIAQQQVGARPFKETLLLRQCRGAKAQREQAGHHLHYYCSPIIGRSRSLQLIQPARFNCYLNLQERACLAIFSIAQGSRDKPAPTGGT